VTPLLVFWRAVRMPFALAIGLLVFFLSIALDMCGASRKAARLEEWLIDFDC